MLVCRYSRAITAITDLLTAWDSMSDVQRALPTEISRLVRGGEAIINGERLAWHKTGMRKDTGAELEDRVQTDAGKNKESKDRGAKISILQE